MVASSKARSKGSRRAALLVASTLAVLGASLSACGTVGTVDPEPEVGGGGASPVKLVPRIAPIDEFGVGGGGGTSSSDETGGATSASGGGSSANSEGGSGGGSACQPDFALCLGLCVDLKIDPLNCGHCGVICGLTESCTEGMCTTGPI